MKVFAISDLHLSAAVDKPMDIFGGNWFDYWKVIKTYWLEYITGDDVVLISGDISWAMSLEQALPDLKDIESLPGKKVFIRGNHDYWWSSISKIRGLGLKDMYFLQNDALSIGDYVICGSRAWICPDGGPLGEDDQKIYNREVERLGLSVACAKRIMQPDQTIVCMTHFPPFNVKREDSGFTKLLEEQGVGTVVYGHLHGKQCRSDKKYCKNGINYYLTSCDQLNNIPAKIFD